MEVGFVELNEWAERVVDKSNPEELWDTLVDQEARVTKLDDKTGRPGEELMSCLQNSVE